MKFRKKPVVIEAVQVSKRMDITSPQWLAEAISRNDIILHGMGKLTRDVPWVEIHTLEGLMRGDEGDWIIRGVAGELYPCKPNIFAKTYEPADAAPPPPEQNDGTLRLPEPMTDAEVFAAGIEAVAAMIEAKARAFADQHGSNDMGSLSFGRGGHADVKADHYASLCELADEVRSVTSAAPTPPVQGDEALEVLKLAFDALTCGDTGDDLEDSHRCGKCDEYVDRNAPVRQRIRALIAKRGEK